MTEREREREREREEGNGEGIVRYRLNRIIMNPL